MLDHRLETFLVLCEVMNYREAANRLNITQPAVTQQIKFLEREYGCPLFTYKNRQLKKTPAADILEKYAQSMRCHDQAIRKKIGQTNIRELRLGATKTIGDYFLRKQVFRFASNCENQLTFIVDNTEHLLKLLDENQLDYAVIEGFFDKNRYDHLLVRREPFVGICPKGHPFAGKQVSISQLLSETIIHREEGSGTRAILEQKLLGHNESLSRFRHSICISSFKIILDMVKHGFGISFVYELLADSDPDIEKFTLLGEPMVREFNIVYIKDADMQEKIDWFFEKEEMP